MARNILVNLNTGHVIVPGRASAFPEARATAGGFLAFDDAAAGDWGAEFSAGREYGVLMGAKIPDVATTKAVWINFEPGSPLIGKEVDVGAAGCRLASMGSRETLELANENQCFVK